MRIGQRLRLGFGIILLLTIGTVAFVFLSLHKIQKLQKIITVHTSNKENAEDLNVYIQQWLITVEYLLNKRDLSQLDYHEILEATIEKEMKEIEWDIYGAPGRTIYEKIARTFNNINKLDNTIQMYLRVGNKLPETINLDDALNTFEADSSSITKTMASMETIVNTTYNQVLAYSKKIEKWGWFSIFVIVPVTICFSIFYAIITTRSITKPLYLLSMTTKTIIDRPQKVILIPNAIAEIRALFKDFNEMSMRLNESADNLEKLSITDKLTRLSQFAQKRDYF